MRSLALAILVAAAFTGSLSDTSVGESLQNGQVQIVESPAISRADSIAYLVQLYNAALEQKQAGLSGEAIASFGRVAKLAEALSAPQDFKASVYAQQGYIEQIAGNSATALRHFQRAYELDPQNPLFMNNLAYALAESDTSLGFAQQLARTAVETEPTEERQETLDFVNYKITLDRFVENARSYLDVPYAYNGRYTENNPTIDCLGILFRAHEKTFGTNWRDFSVNPSRIVELRQLGNPVKGLDGVFTGQVDRNLLQKGDIIYLLCTREIEDEPLAYLDGQPYWPWHTGIYSDKKRNLFLEAQPGNVVLERDFGQVLKENTAIFVTRLPYSHK